MTKSFGVNLSRFIDAVLALLLILNCQSIYQDSSGINFYVYEITALFIVISAVVKFSLNRISWRNFKYFSIILCVYCFYLALIIASSVEVNLVFSFLGRYGLFPFVILSFLVDSSIENKYYIFKKFVDWVVLITLISLVFWLFGSTFNIIKPSSSFNYFWGQELSANSYLGLYFETQFVDWIGIDWFYRNTAIFVEGPMFCLVLILAITFMISSPIKLKRFKIKVVILCLGLITTFSTTGLLFLGVLILLYFYRKVKLRKYLWLILPVIFIVCLIFLIKKSSTGSFSWRIDDYAAGFKTWLSKPLFGYGFNNFDAVIANKSSSGNIGFSNAIFAVLVQGGALFGSLFIAPIIYGIVHGAKNKQFAVIFLSLCYALLFILILFQTAFINIYVWALIYLFPVKSKRKKNYVSKKNCKIISAVGKQEI